MGIESIGRGIPYKIGRNLGNRIFDALKEGRVSPKIERQRSAYVDQIGRSFVAFIAIVYVGPFVFMFWKELMEFMRPSYIPDTLMFDLMYFTPPFHYEAYGNSIILVGSLFLASQLFSNFLFEEIERGALLALGHAGVADLMAGTLFQSYRLFDTDVSPPDPDLWVISTTEILSTEMNSDTVERIDAVQYAITSDMLWTLYYLIDNFEYIGHSFFQYLLLL